MSDQTSGSAIKRRLRSSGEAFAEHTLETAKNAAKGLENTHAAYIYPIQVNCSAQGPCWPVGNLLFLYSSWPIKTFLFGSYNSSRYIRRNCGSYGFLWICSPSTDVPWKVFWEIGRCVDDISGTIRFSGGCRCSNRWKLAFRQDLCRFFHHKRDDRGGNIWGCNSTVFRKLTSLGSPATIKRCNPRH